MEFSKPAKRDKLVNLVLDGSKMLHCFPVTMAWRGMERPRIADGRDTRCGR
jgi:hypothetical protein